MSSITIIRQHDAPNILIRILYFLFIGLWLSGIWATVAWVFSVSIIGLPVGIWMLNRLPLVSTLHPQQNDLMVTGDGRIVATKTEQLPLLIRAVYFLLIGWWLSAVWLSVAWALSAIIIGLPFSFWMIDRVPAVLTLAR